MLFWLHLNYTKDKRQLLTKCLLIKQIVNKQNIDGMPGMSNVRVPYSQDFINSSLRANQLVWSPEQVMDKWKLWKNVCTNIIFFYIWSSGKYICEWKKLRSTVADCQLDWNFFSYKLIITVLYRVISDVHKENPYKEQSQE